MQIIWIQKPNSAKSVFKLSKFLFRLLEKTSFSEEFNFTVMLPTVKYLVCLFFGYWIEEIDVWVKRITHIKKNIASWFLCKKENPCIYNKTQNLARICSETINDEIFINIVSCFLWTKKIVGVSIYQKNRINIKTLIFIHQ